MRSERVRMVARLLKMSKIQDRKCIIVTAKLWFWDLNYFYLATVHMKARVAEGTAVCNNVLSLFFDKNKNRFLVSICFMHLFSSKLCWYSHSYCLFTLLLPRLSHGKKAHQWIFFVIVLINEINTNLHKRPASIHMMWRQPRNCPLNW